jgi:hypothetical protein
MPRPFFLSLGILPLLEGGTQIPRVMLLQFLASLCPLVFGFESIFPPFRSVVNLINTGASLLTTKLTKERSGKQATNPQLRGNKAAEERRGGRANQIAAKATPGV